jgi:hypothetical protein
MPSPPKDKTCKILRIKRHTQPFLSLLAVRNNPDAKNTRTGG